MPFLALRERVLRAAASAAGLPRVQRGAAGTVILPFGRYFAGRADLLTRDGFKTIVPIDGVSPFSGVGEPDSEMQHFADSERVNERVQIEVRKDLAARLAQADAEYLVVDNSTAILTHRQVNGRLYTVHAREETDLVDALWNTDAHHVRTLAVKLSRQGLTDDLRSTYDSFVRACLDSFDPTKIILILSHMARFWIAEDGTIAPTDVNRSDARFLAELDSYFLETTGCRVATGALSHFPSAVKWQTFDHRMRRAIEQDLVELCRPRRRPASPGDADVQAAHDAARTMSAADHVVGAFRQNRPVNQSWLRNYFQNGGASYDDLMALAYLDQGQPGSDGDLVRSCVRSSVADAHSRPLAVTKRGFERSLRALRFARWRTVTLPRGERWTPQITVPGESVQLRFLGDGSIQRIPVERVGPAEADRVVEGQLPITPLNVCDVLGSWPVYFKRGRRGITSAFRVVVADAAELLDSCSWLDWAQVLENERVVITTPGVKAVPTRGPKAKTDLSFIFDPNVRVGTVGGGLMDQVTHIALFDDLCTPHGFDYYLDDFRYTWWRSHNGFEASRLAPHLERKRITRLVSQALIESFRDEVMKTRLPWVFNQSRVWYEFGLREATVVTRNYFNSRRLLEIGPKFPVLLYNHDEQLGQLIERPPTPVCFYTTQHRIPVASRSAAAIRRVFSYSHLTASGLDPDVAQTAALLRGAPHVAFHVRRTDYLHPHFDTRGWHAEQSHYIEAITYLIDTEFGTDDFNIAVFSDDLEFVEAHVSDYGLDRVSGDIRFIRGNRHYKSIYDSYLMSLCPVIVGSVGFFAATTSLLADPPSVFIRVQPGAVRVNWRR